MERGLVHLYCGDGKGKTTAAIGLAVRAAGRGLRVGIAQFLKSGDSGELLILSGLEMVRIFPFLKDVKFTFAMSEDERRTAREFYTGLLEKIKNLSSEFDFILLDEAVSAVTESFIELASLLEFIKNRPSGLEMVITGRNPPEELINAADYISEIRCAKHPYQKGIGARKGIEW
ncbi:MAG: cob(I)yrinic acid a,c-diamide adenosyltransferase [Clostridiales bacterium]|jgi:cob(I)alamin adenosyltransferase|nr:cob(I)yrinic acid a,c-diamide adenosyltransferase [Clostridiales bacterium]